MSAIKLLAALLPDIELFMNEADTSACHTELLATVIHFKEVPKEYASETTYTQIAKYVSVLPRYFRYYFKMESEPVFDISYDEFTYIAYMLFDNSQPKIDVIHKNVHEKTTGVEIINRLLKKELIYETANAMISKIDNICEMIAGDLNETERQYFVYILHKLKTFHHPHYLARTVPNVTGKSRSTFNLLGPEFPAGESN
jgi:hypothetical protein